MSDDPAHVLFPNDAPAASKPPEWFHAQHAAAEARLSGRHGTTQDDAAARLFPSEAPKAKAQPPAGAETDDPAKVLFKNDAAAEFDAQPVNDFFSGFAASAATDRDHERVSALEAAGKALVADFKAAGTDAADVAEALAIIKDRQGDTVAGPVSVEKLEADKDAGLAALAAEGVSDADIRAAQRLVADLDVIAPGTIDSLISTGAGNDIRLIRKAIAEARKRGY